MGKKKNYESPFVKRAQVETESGFCAASIIEEVPKDGIKNEGHEVGLDIDAGFEGSGEKWDQGGWQ